MGLYLNPKGMTKKDWLEQHAKEVPLEAWTWEQREAGQMPLCLIYAPWPAVLICYFRREMERALPVPGRDERPRRYYFAPISEVKKQPDLKGLVPSIRADTASGYTKEPVEI